MNKLIDKILKEAEDSSDDFFQSKHINKREEELDKQIKVKKKEALIKLKNGIKEIRIAYKGKGWRSDSEILFLELFSKLHVDTKLYQNEYGYGYYLLDKTNKETCSYNIKDDIFWIEYETIWKIFNTQLNMNYYDIKTFIKNMLDKYFNLHNVVPHSYTLRKDS